MRRFAALLATALTAVTVPLAPPPALAAGTSPPAVSERLATRVSIAASPATPLVGETVTLTGLLEWQGPDGAWEPLPGKPVWVRFHDLDTWAVRELGTMPTGTDGRFTATATVTASGYYDAIFPPETGYTASSATTHTVWTRSRTAVVESDAGPEPVAAGATVTLRAKVVRYDAAGARVPAARVPAVLQFSPDGLQWQNIPFEKLTGADGRLILSGTATRDGYWRARYDGGPYMGGGGTTVGTDEPSSGWADHVDVRYATRISSFNASPEPVRKGATITVQGRLDRLVGSWKPAAAGAAINIYFKPSGSSAWTTMTGTKTDGSGRFTRTFTASKDGTWLATYKGSATYLGSQGPGDHVDVR
ncbi:hypothetical protein GCM10023085_80790 [Actinomadura viridis]|uniref:Htaa domain-containing protein n=1 Tax=Actinomadura viridis TaxID=58110 RepID=A0A931DJ34_9ACTN|nr:hypothetical protein [Actinomadura viridis]MBG6092129.1 hypothetical protein [Actinomadura viridis]